MVQDKRVEISFFDHHADTEQEYNVFSPLSSQRLIHACVDLAGWQPGAHIVDLGCGSGIFTDLLRQRGFRCSALDISHGLVRAGGKRYPQVHFLTGDVEWLPFADNSVDGVLLSGLIHHLPDPLACAAEVLRVLKPGGRFVAFDPNRLNPFMWLYRDRSSPFYSSKGVTPNERPVVAAQVARTFTYAGFDVSHAYLSNLRYTYVASPVARVALPLYNALDSLLFDNRLLAPFSAFVLTRGEKQ